ncbi:MAG: hypothetical protein HC905_16220 [Bacteroidales bacterium]|nr:hypothetical protein [Bacteroidales bacterium]
MNSIEMDNNHHYYIGTTTGTVFRSEDHGKTWQKSTDPSPGYNGYILLKSAGDVLWASSNKSLWYTANGGLSWKIDTVGIPSGEVLSEISQAPDSTFYMVTNDGKLLKSEGLDKPWKKLNFTEFVKNIYITKTGDIIINASGGNLNIYKSSDNGATFNKVHTVSVAFWSSYSFNFVIPYKEGFLMLLPGNGIWFTKEFNTYTSFWNNTNLINFNKLKDNVLIARDVNADKVYYLNGN